MTLLPITKEYFHKICGKVREWRKYHIQLDKVFGELDTRFYSNTTILYFETKDIPGRVVAYIVPLNILVIPDEYDGDLNISSDVDIDFSDWNYSIEKNKHNPEYTINVFHRSSDRWQELSNTLLESIVGDFSEKSEITLTNERIGYSKKIEIRLEINSWSNSVFFGYNEKLELPFNREKLKELDNEIFNILLWTRKQH